MDKTGILIVIVGLILFLLYQLKNCGCEGISVSQMWDKGKDCTKFIRPKMYVPPKPCGFHDTFAKDSRCSSCKDCVSIVDKNSCFNERAEKYTGNVILPPISENILLVKKTSIDKLDLNEVMKHLDQGDLIVSAKNEQMIEYLIHKIQFAGGNGYPDFYYVDGPVIVMQKNESDYYYMVDYPIKYNPKNMKKYSNVVDNVSDATSTYTLGARLLEGCSPVYIFKTKYETEKSKQKDVVCKKKCKKSIWGSRYGCGNWLLRV